MYLTLEWQLRDRKMYYTQHPLCVVCSVDLLSASPESLLEMWNSALAPDLLKQNMIPRHLNFILVRIKIG